MEKYLLKINVIVLLFWKIDKFVRNTNYIENTCNDSSPAYFSETDIKNNLSKHVDSVYRIKYFDRLLIVYCVSEIYIKKIFDRLLIIYCVFEKYESKYSTITFIVMLFIFTEMFR